MRINDLVRVTCPIARLSDPFAYMAQAAAGRAVLNVGAAGGVAGYLPHNKEIWLHHRLAQAAGQLVGIDIDKPAIDYAGKHGVTILNENCETMSLADRFDLIVLSDVIEHMNAPVDAVVNLMRHLKPQGKLCITTPNPLSLLGLTRLPLGQAPNVYWDHVACYLPEHIQAICDRYGFALKAIYYFDHVDRRTRLLSAKSYLSIAVGKLLPRVSSSFMAVIEHDAAK